MIMKINTPPLNTMLIYMCAKFGSRSYKIATGKVNHRISARCIQGVAMAFRPKKLKFILYMKLPCNCFAELPTSI